MILRLKYLPNNAIKLMEARFHHELAIRGHERRVS